MLRLQKLSRIPVYFHYKYHTIEALNCSVMADNIHSLSGEKENNWYVHRLTWQKRTVLYIQNVFINKCTLN